MTIVGSQYLHSLWQCAKGRALPRVGAPASSVAWFMAPRTSDVAASGERRKAPSHGGDLTAIASNRLPANRTARPVLVARAGACDRRRTRKFSTGKRS